MHKLISIFLNFIPVLVMIILIPFVQNDYVLTVFYILIIAVALYIKKEHGDYVIMSLGFVAMIVSELLFVNSGAEIFLRNSLFGIMPLWLPFLWAYAFVAIKRSVKVLNY